MQIATEPMLDTNVEESATAAFTLDVYGHVSDKMKDANASRMEQYVRSLTNA